MMGNRRDKLGRHAPLGDIPSPDLAREGRRAMGKIEVRHAVETDPNYAPGQADHSAKGKRQRVAVNIATDPPEREHAYGGLAPAAYEAGRAYRAILEIARGR